MPSPSSSTLTYSPRPYLLTSLCLLSPPPHLPTSLQGPEISPLLDALGRNSSLVYLDLTKSGLTWTSPTATGRPLLEHMASSTAALSGLKHLSECTWHCHCT